MMSLSWSKKLWRLTQVQSHIADCHHEVGSTGSRLYSGKVFSSASPQAQVGPVRHQADPLKFHKLNRESQKSSFQNSKQKRESIQYHQYVNPNSTVNKTKQHADEYHIRKNYRLDEDPKYEKRLIMAEKSINESSHDSNTSTKFEATDSDDVKNYRDNFGREHLFELHTKSNDDGSLENSNTENHLEPYTGEMKFGKYKVIDTPLGRKKYDLSADEFKIKDFIMDLNLEPPKPLSKCEEDISDFGPNHVPTFNFAAYADDSKLIQQFVKLGVKLHKVEKNLDHMRALLTVDMEKELPVYIQFLHDCGVPADTLGDVITENPMILKEDMDDMKTRIRYLRAHDFSREEIARIVTKNPTWLVWATKHIDERLGHFQSEFKLQGHEVRFLATKAPKLITYNFKHIHENTFAIREEMGFDKKQIKHLLLLKPRIWIQSRRKIIDSFDYLHNTMKLPHEILLRHPDTMTCRKIRLKNRHEFLTELKRVQYDATKPNYISPTTIACGSDVEFCRDVAKTSIDTYNLFLKTR